MESHVNRRVQVELKAIAVFKNSGPGANLVAGLSTYSYSQLK